MTKPVALIRFVNDLDTGWYHLDEPTGDKSDWNWASSAQQYCDSMGWDLAYAGDPQYKPVDIKQAPSRTYTLS